MESVMNMPIIDISKLIMAEAYSGGCSMVFGCQALGPLMVGSMPYSLHWFLTPPHIPLNRQHLPPHPYRRNFIKFVEWLKIICFS